MIEARRHHARDRAHRNECRRKLRDARLQREHLGVDARERAAETAVVGIEYGGGFRHWRVVAGAGLEPTTSSA